MNSQDIFDGITDIRDDLIDRAKSAPNRQKRRMKKYWLGTVAAVLVIAVIGNIFLNLGGGQTVYAIARAEYPEMAPYPLLESDNSDEEADNAWYESVRAQRRNLGDISSLQSFFAQSSRTFLTGAERENRVYSPLNVYMALSMLAQLTDGESREQILTLLGSDSMDNLRQQASDIWNSNYRNDGALTSILASSLWLNRDIKFNQDTMDILARDFYASSYRGKMGSEEFNNALQSWLNEQTGGLLEQQVEGIELDAETVLALATTVYFKAKWKNQFSGKNTSPQIFHSPDGDVETDFMHEQLSDGYYFWSDKFTALCQNFSNESEMWFILPDEGISPEELLTDSETMEFLFSENKSKWENHKWLYVNKSIPKFDVCSKFDLKEGLKDLGVTDVFDSARSDFSPMTGNSKEIAITQVDHAARVVIDEEGCTAAAFTNMALSGAAGPENMEVDFVLDRPFIFCITGISGLPLFVGIVNYPTEK